MTQKCWNKLQKILFTNFFSAQGAAGFIATYKIKTVKMFAKRG
jgi:hypothetical protein